jgi:hypothetical protein
VTILPAPVLYRLSAAGRRTEKYEPLLIYKPSLPVADPAPPLLVPVKMLSFIPLLALVPALALAKGDNHTCAVLPRLYSCEISPATLQSYDTCCTPTEGLVLVTQVCLPLTVRHGLIVSSGTHIPVSRRTGRSSLTAAGASMVSGPTGVTGPTASTATLRDSKSQRRNSC